MNVKYCLTRCLALAGVMSVLILHTAHAQGLQARIDTRTLAIGDTLTLSLTVDTDRASGAPDLSPLEKDFEILGNTTSSLTSVINGVRSSTMTWNITLGPRQTGHIDIPSLSAGSASSEPLSLDVVEAADLPAGSSRSQGVQLEWLLDDAKHYVNQEIPIKLRITSGTALSQVSLQAPNSKDFTLHHSGDDRSSQIQRDGQTLTVIERTYRLTPHRSGPIILPPVVLHGVASEASANGSDPAFPGVPSVFGRSPFGSSLLNQMFSHGRRVQVRSAPLSLDVLPSPIADNGWFLPARHVELQAAWPADSSAFKVGDAITRTIRLVALGASEEKLPALNFNDAAGMRMYHDRTDDRTIDTPDGTAAMREFTVSVVPIRAGELTLPAIEVPWWDTTTDQQRTAILPAETITVAAASGTPAAPVRVDATTDPDTKSVQTSTTREIGSALHANRWVGLWSGSAMAALLLVALAVLVRRKLATQHKGTASGPADRSNAGEHGGRWFYHRISRNSKRQIPGAKARARAGVFRAHGKRVITACEANDPQGAYAAVLDLAGQAPWAHLLDRSALYCHDAALASGLDALESHLFNGQPETPWNGAALRTALQRHGRQLEKQHKHRRSSATGVPTLYPA